LNVAGDEHGVNAPPSKLQVYPGVPPENVTVILPVPGAHFGSVFVDDVVTGVGLVMVAGVVVVQPLASFTVIV
jgi:hypothetical protein